MRPTVFWVSNMTVRLYEENEVHRCTNCGLMLRVTFAAVPIEPITCCGKDMDLLGILPTDETLDLTIKPAPDNALERVYKPGDVYSCSICGIDVTILVQAQPSKPLDCCGEGMEMR